MAAIAAALSDSLVEAFANHGAFGAGSFTDGSSAVNAPVAGLGALFLLRFLYLRVRRGLRVDGGLAAIADRLSCELTGGAVARRLPAIFGLQIAGLWAMETAEQYAVFGHGFGPAVWLGGPVAISLIAQAVFCVLTAFAARAVLRAVEPRALRLIRALLGVLGTVGDARRPRLTSRAEPLPVRSCLVPCRIGVRAPPAAVS